MYHIVCDGMVFSAWVLNCRLGGSCRVSVFIGGHSSPMYCFEYDVVVCWVHILGGYVRLLKGLFNKYA